MILNIILGAALLGSIIAYINKDKEARVYKDAYMYYKKKSDRLMDGNRQLWTKWMNCVQMKKIFKDNA